jgi:hypothetical protein
MKKKPVKSFDEFFAQKGKEEYHIPQEGRIKKKDKKIYLDPDMQNPTSQADTALGWSVGFPFGGI